MNIKYIPLFLPALFFFCLPILRGICQERNAKAKKEQLAHRKAAAKKDEKPAPVQVEKIQPEKKEDAAPADGIQNKPEPRRKRGRPRKSPAAGPDLPTTCTLEEFAAAYMSA